MAAAWLIGVTCAIIIHLLTDNAPISIVGGSICCLIWYFKRKEQ